MTKPRYRTTNWKGYDNYECEHCPYSTLDRGEMVLHVKREHPTPAEGAAHEAGPLAGIDWATDRGAEVASELGLTAEDFQHHSPTGETGYTVADVRAIAAARTNTEEE